VKKKERRNPHPKQFSEQVKVEGEKRKKKEQHSSHWDI